MKPVNILLIGNGGREHTLAWKISQSDLCKKLFIAPGNGGTGKHGVNLDIGVTDFNALKAAALEHAIDMILVGPEEPLVKGISDFFNSDKSTAHIKIIGPSMETSQLEGSKSFAKAFMERHGIPTAAYREFTMDTYADGVDYIRQHPLPIVLKADGLAAGKGVLICQTHLEALAEFELVVMHAKFGEAGNKVVIEQFLEGIEMSAFILTDGKDYLLLPEAKDYKRIGENDKGLNTGGMGAVSPLPFFDDVLKGKVIQKIIEPTIVGLQHDHLKYTGFVFIGLMIVDGEPVVIEYNCRMGDPETEVVIPRIKNDLVAVLLAAADGNLSSVKLEIDPQYAVAVVAVSGGYPGTYIKGYEISGLDSIKPSETIMFHAGTRAEGDKIITNGGRVIAATSFGESISEAAEISTYNLEQVFFENMYFRSDIGYEFRRSQTNVKD